MLIISLSTFQYCMYVLSPLSIDSGETKFEIFHGHITYILYYDAGPACLIRSIRTVYKYRKCSFLTGLITSLNNLLQDNRRGRIGTSKTKSTDSPVRSRSLRSPNSSVSRSPNFFPFSPGACSQASHLLNSNTK